MVVLALVAGMAGARFVGLAEKKRDMVSGAEYALNHFTDFTAAGMPILGTSANALLIAVAIAAIVFTVYLRWATQGTFRRGEEHGSSKWASRAAIQKFGDFGVPVNNVILSKDVRMRYTRGPDFVYERTRNVLVVGGSGSGKTRGYVKPNLMQYPSSPSPQCAWPQEPPQLH